MLLKKMFNSSKPTFKVAGAGVGARAGEKNTPSQSKTDRLGNTNFKVYLHVWIRIHRAPEYGSSTDPDPQN